MDVYIGFGLGCIYGSLTYDPATVKTVEVDVSPIVYERQIVEKSDFTMYRIKLEDSTRLKVMVDWIGDDLRQVRYKIKSDKLVIKDESVILKCNKNLTVVKNGKLTAIELSLGRNVYIRDLQMKLLKN